MAAPSDASLVPKAALASRGGVPQAPAEAETEPQAEEAEEAEEAAAVPSEPEPECEYADEEAAPPASALTALRSEGLGGAVVGGGEGEVSDVPCRAVRCAVVLHSAAWHGMTWHMAYGQTGQTPLGLGLSGQLHP